MKTLYDNNYEVKRRDESLVSLNEYKGKVLIIVNTATGCGFTPQYEALERLYRQYHDKGLEVLDFPCNQFGHQAPGSDGEIHEFCQAKYQTSFDQFKKIDVNGENEDKVFTFLKDNDVEEYIKGVGHKMTMKSVKAISKTCKNKNDIKWNFTKFLLNQNGQVIMRVSPIEDPMVMEDKIKELLGE